MPRLLNGCLSICCISRKNRQSFPISEKKSHDTKQKQKQKADDINRVTVRPVGSLRLTGKTIVPEDPKEKTATVKKSKSACSKTKKTMTKSDGDTAVGNQQAKPSSKTKKKPVDAPPPVQKLFQKSKTPKTPSPVAISIQPLSEDKPTNTVPSLSSEWPSTTISEPIEPKKGARAARGTTKRQLNRKQTSKRPAGKSRLVLQNVRKMIEDQSSHDPPLQHDRPKESAQL